MDKIYEVHTNNKAGKEIVTAHYDPEEAIHAAIKMSKSNGKASLVTVDVDEDEVETEVAQTIYVKGEPQGESILNKVRTKMDDATLAPLKGDAGVKDEAYKATKKAEREAAKAAKAEERAAKKAEREAVRAARKAAGGIKTGPRQKFDDEAVIKLNVAENPKRAGSKAFGWYAGYMDGMTVKDYRELLGKGQANACLDWDEKRNYISISGGTPEPETGTGQPSQA